MALPLAPVRRPKTKACRVCTTDEQIHFQGMTDADLDRLVDAARSGDSAGVRALLPVKGRLMAVAAQKLEKASSFEMLKVWLDKAPRMYTLDARWRFGATEAKQILDVVKGRVDLEFNNHILRRVAEEDSELIPRIKTSGPKARAQVFYDKGLYQHLKKALSKWNSSLDWDPPHFQRLFERDYKWAKLIWSTFSYHSEIEELFVEYRQSLIDKSDTAGLSRLDKICENRPVRTWEEKRAGKKEA